MAPDDPRQNLGPLPYTDAIGIILGLGVTEEMIPTLMAKVNWADAVIESLEGHRDVGTDSMVKHAIETLVGLGTCTAAEALEKLRRRGTDTLTISISRVGAESFVSDSAGYGAIGMQEVTEAVQAALDAQKDSA
jgi:hypothetical protein